MSNYCEIAKGHPLHGPYHDKEYGFHISSEAALFERLVMEIFQAGLSWLIVLKKRQALRDAFENFDVGKISEFTDADVKQLLRNSSIIRNKLKIQATIFNAQRLIQFRNQYGGFSNWIDNHHPLKKEEWSKIFRENFKFTGPIIVEEFLRSIGYLPGAHAKHCPVYQNIEKMDPPWKSI